MRAKLFLLVFGFRAFLVLEGISVNNIILFVCGISVTLMCGMGVLVYMVHLGYKHEEEKIKEKKMNEFRVKAKIDADLGVVESV
jgi:hypothetical protein